MRSFAVGCVLPLVLAGGIPSVGMQEPRAAHTATLLADGSVLLVGGCSVDSCELDERGATTEVFDAGSGRFRDGPRLSRPRVGHVAARLPDGRVLIAGGWSSSALTASAELYDAGRFVPTGGLRVARGGATATVLRDGRVLVAGGSVGGKVTRSAELYDPSRDGFVSTGRMGVARGGHAAVRLRDGRVLVVGGSDGSRVLGSTEIFDPRTGRFRGGPRLRVARHKHAAVTLRNGTVLVLGGSSMADFYGRYSSAEVVDVRRRSSRRVRPLAHRRFKLGDSVVRLPGGEVLVAGGSAILERYEPRSRRFVPAGRIGAALAFATATVLPDGRVLVAGGYDEQLKISRRAYLVHPLVNSP